MSIEGLNEKRIEGFAGELRGFPEHSMALHVSPDAVNCDYRYGKLRKRGGFRRATDSVVNDGVLSGGVEIAFNSVAPTPAPRLRGILPGISASADLTVEWMQCIRTDRASSFVWSLQLETHTPTAKVRLKAVFPGNYTLEWVGGAAWDTGIPVVFDEWLPCRMYFPAATPNHCTLTIGESSVTKVLDAFTWPASYWFCTFGESSVFYVPRYAYLAVDDIRVWHGAVAVSLFDERRELVSAEKTAALIAYWRFNQEDYNSATDDWANKSGNYSYVMEANGTVSAVEGSVAYNDFGSVTGLVDGGSSGLLYCSRNYVRVIDLATTVTSLVSFVPQVGHNWSSSHHMEWAILTNGETENYRWHPTYGWSWLSFPAPTLSDSPLAAEASAGGSLGAGTYWYLFTLYDSVTGVEGDISDVISVVSDGTKRGLIRPDSVLAIGVDGWDSVKVYRTKVDAPSEFFYLVSFDRDGADFYDDAADGTLVTLWSPYDGYVEAARFSLSFLGSLFVGGLATAQNRMAFTEAGTLAGFYYRNTIDVGDSEPIEGAVDVGGSMVIFKRNSIWLLTGDGATTFGVRKLYDGVGCVNGATIGVSHRGVYFLGANGVYVLPLSLGSAPPQLVFPSQSFFQSFTVADYDHCCGVFDALRARYIVSFRRGGVGCTLVFDEAASSWALWDAVFDALALSDGAGGAPEVYAGWRGRVVQLCESGVEFSDGVQTILDQSITQAGVATGGSINTVASSGSFPAVETALIGADVKVTHENGVSEVRRVWFHNDSVLYVEPDFSAACADGDAWELGVIDSYWSSPKFQFAQHLGEKVAVRSVAVLQAGEAHVGGSASMVLDGTAGTAITLATGERLVRSGVKNGSGVEGSVRIEDSSGSSRFSVDAIAVRFEELNRLAPAVSG